VLVCQPDNGTSPHRSRLPRHARQHGLLLRGQQRAQLHMQICQCQRIRFKQSDGWLRVLRWSFQSGGWIFAMSGLMRAGPSSFSEFHRDFGRPCSRSSLRIGGHPGHDHGRRKCSGNKQRDHVRPMDFSSSCIFHGLLYSHGRLCGGKLVTGLPFQFEIIPGQASPVRGNRRRLRHAAQK